MIVNARAKRDKHFYLIRKLNERLSRKNIVIEEGGNSSSKMAEMASKDMSLSQKLSSPGLFASMGKGGSQRSLFSPGGKRLSESRRPESPPMLRFNSEQQLPTQKQLQINFKMHPMETIKESDAGSRSSRRGSSVGKPAVPAEFAAEESKSSNR